MPMAMLRAACVLRLAAGAGAVTFHVDPGGNDAHPGTTNQPFATLGRARDAIREMKKKENGLREPVEVLVRGGTYRLAEPLVLAPEDSGTATAAVSYAAAPGASPVLSGGRTITGWRKGTGDVWTARAPEAEAGTWGFHQLFVNGRRAIRARRPNEGYLRSEGPLKPYPHDRAKAGPESRIGLRFKAGDLKPWADIGDADLVLYHSWTASWHGIADLDETNRTVRFTNPSGWPVSWWERDQRYRVENLASALDAPGEWFLDRKSGEVRYFPRPGEDPAKAEFVAPALRNLVRFEGQPDQSNYVEHVTLRGLSLQHADWDFDRTKVADGQAAVFLGAAVSADGARDCVLEGCKVAHVGEYAILFNHGCQSNRIERCHLHDLGAGGVRIGESMRSAKDMPKSDTVRTGGHAVLNCFIHDGGHVFPAGVGVWVGQSANNIIAHNEVCDFFYSGMSLGWTWGYGPHEARGNVVEFNRIHHLGGGVLSDMGGVYTLGTQPGTVIRNNIIHDVLSYSYGGWGLYTDEGSTDIVMENNLVYLTKTGGYHHHYGKNVIVRNNILALAAEGQVQRSREEEHCSFIFERNIVCQDRGPLLAGRWDNGNFRMDSNMYWRAGGDPALSGMTIGEWQQETGQDIHSVIADPHFVSTEKADFALKPESPAAKIGFVEFDLAPVGLVGDKAWVEAPRRIERAPTPFVAWADRLTFSDSFERTPAGFPPTNAAVSGADAPGGLAVTEETAASGQRSLKVTDAAGLPQVFHPHFYYRTDLLRGTAELSFDLRIQPGALPWIEGRDARQPYRAGPSVRVNGKGALQAGHRVLMPFPTNAWVHLAMRLGLGQPTNGTYSLEVRTPGETRRFEGLPFAHPAFGRLQWVGISSLATNAAVFYLDNLELKQEKSDTP